MPTLDELKEQIDQGATVQHPFLNEKHGRTQGAIVSIFSYEQQYYWRLAYVPASGMQEPKTYRYENWPTLIQTIQGIQTESEQWHVVEPETLRSPGGAYSLQACSNKLHLECYSVINRLQQEILLDHADYETASTRFQELAQEETHG